MLRAIIAVSKDGFVAREENDKMSWLGPIDKQIFRILTASNGNLGVSSKTARLMPPKLEGRKLHKLSRDTPCNLRWFHALANHWNGAWLIGGQEIILAALVENFIDEFHICRSSRYAFPSDETCIHDEITPFLQEHSRWNKKMETKIVDVHVECWRYAKK